MSFYSPKVTDEAMRKATDPREGLLFVVFVQRETVLHSGAPLCIPSNNVPGLQFLHILTIACGPLGILEKWYLS
jgi:hypothetical protein